MKLADFNRLKKFMALTDSDVDAEAMGALKAANNLLRKESLTWERVLSRSVKIISEAEEAPEDYGSGPQPAAKSRTVPASTRSNSDDELEEAIEIVENSTIDGTFRYTLENIIAWYRKSGKISERQKEVVINASKRGNNRL